MMTTKLPTYDKYKPSGVEWLGEIPEHWHTKKLKFLGEIYAGLNGKKGDDFSKEYSPGIKPYIPFTNICNNIKISDEQFHFVKVDEKENQTRVLKNDILFLMSSETLEDIAKCSIYLGNNNELYLNSFCKGFRFFSAKINPEFINYLFLSSTYRSYFSLVGRGFTRINLKQEFINDAISLIPPRPEQTAIAQFLDRKTALIDQAIDIKQKQIELLKERRQILIHQAVTRGLNPEVKMKDSGVEWIGEVPEHWEVVRNRELFQERKEPGNENLPLLAVSIHTAVSSEELSEEENIRGRIRIEDKSLYKLVEIGDVVFNMMRAWQGAIGAVSTKGMVSPAYVVARPKKTFDSNFFEYQYRTETFIKQMDRSSKGITDFRKRLYWNEFKQLVTILPPPNEQQEISRFISTLNAKTDKAFFCKQQEIAKLQEYKATLINSAVTGKIKIK
jgi:type I restriction enzyme S subunit